MSSGKEHVRGKGREQEKRGKNSGEKMEIEERLKRGREEGERIKIIKEGGRWRGREKE